VNRHTTSTLFWGTLGALLCSLLFASAGTWQLGRAAEKRVLFAAFERGEGAEALAELPPDSQFDALRYQPLVLQGRYDAAHQVLLDTVVVDGVVGYFVLTPFRTASGNVLVNRGFIPALRDRSTLPDIPVGEGQRLISGIMDALPRPGLRLADRDTTEATPWPRRLAFPNTTEVAAQLGYPLRDYQLLLYPDEPDGYLRRWSPATMAPEQHLGYAVQWFGLLGAVLVVYFSLLWRYLRARRK